MRFLLLTAAVAFAASATAQPTFRLTDPALFLDDARVLTTGAPLVQSPFGILSIAVPGQGTFTVSDRPFEGAARAGLFDGEGLFFHAGGRDIRLVSRRPILSETGPVTAYAQFVPSRVRRARGLAQLSVAEAVDGRGRRSMDQQPVVVASGPVSSVGDRPARRALTRMDRQERNVRNATADRPAARYLRDDEARRLARQVDLAETDRNRLAMERDRVARTQGWNAPVVQRTSMTRTSSADPVPALLATQRGLEADRNRIALERDQLVASLGRTEAERDRLAAEFSALRARAEAAEAQASRAGRTRSDFERVEAEVVRLRAEQSDLRSQIETRDRAIVTLSSETRDRSSRIPALEAEIASLSMQLADAVAARDRAIADRNEAYAQRDRALLNRDAAIAMSDQLRVDLADARATPSLDLSAERAALDRDRRLLEADRAALAAERATLEDAVRRSSADADILADRQDLLAELSAAQADREALIAERSALITERDRLAAALEARSDAALPMPPAPVAGTTIREAGPEGALAFLPGFDFARLENPDVIRRRLDEAEYPRWATVGRIEGDVLVLFQADRNGRVVRTAVPTPIGGGLDALAEEIVREMRFDPPVVDGQPTGLRSQVVVRFEL